MKPPKFNIGDKVFSGYRQGAQTINGIFYDKRKYQYTLEADHSESYKFEEDKLFYTLREAQLPILIDQRDRYKEHIKCYTKGVKEATTKLAAIEKEIASLKD